MLSIIVHHITQHTLKSHHPLSLNHLNLQQEAPFIHPTLTLKESPLTNIPCPINPFPKHRIQFHLPDIIIFY
jgi:hypothetical protein